MSVKIESSKRSIGLLTIFESLDHNVFIPRMDVHCLIFDCNFITLISDVGGLAWTSGFEL